MEMLSNNSYILTELIQEDIQNYIYYQAQTMEVMRGTLHRQAMNFIIYMTLLLSGLALLAFYLTTKISRRISVPIIELSRVTHEIARGVFSVPTWTSRSLPGRM